MLQGVVLVYFSIMTVLFTMHVVIKPRISDSSKSLHRQKLKYWLIWLPFTVIVFACEVLIV